MCLCVDTIVYISVQNCLKAKGNKKSGKQLARQIRMENVFRLGYTCS